MNRRNNVGKQVKFNSFPTKYTPKWRNEFRYDNYREN